MENLKIDSLLSGDQFGIENNESLSLKDLSLKFGHLNDR